MKKEKSKTNKKQEIQKHKIMEKIKKSKKGLGELCLGFKLKD